MKRVYPLVKMLFLALMTLALSRASAQPVIDGAFDAANWGAAHATANGSAGWANANARKLYIVETDCYLYLGAEVTASSWMAWAFILNSGPGGGSADTWSRSIDYAHTNKPNAVLRGHFGGYSEFHLWNGASWTGIGSAVAATEFGENITGNDQNGWVELRIDKADLGYPSSIDVQFYITGDQNAHGSFDAVPDDDNATSWNETGNRTQLNNYAAAFALSGSPVVTVSPALPTPEEPVTVTFNAACTPLAGAAKVYFHSGVSTTEGAPAQFNRTVGNWGQDDGVGEMTNIGANLWQIVLPSLRAYYSVDDTEDVFGLNYLFRSADGTIKEDQGGLNYFNAVNTGSYFTITAPEGSPHLQEVNTAFAATFEANVAPVSWTLDEVDANNDFIANLSSQSGGAAFTHNITLVNTSLRRFRATADFGGGVIKIKYFEAKGYPTVNLVARPAGVQPGINYDPGDPSRATLVLHAPTYTRFRNGLGVQTGTNPTTPKNVVYVVGDFNNWTVDDAYLMNRDRDGWDGSVDADGDGDRGDYWWIELTGLIPGQEYVFQYLIDGQLQVADPYAEKISDFDDAFIPDEVYPNLISYRPQAQDRASVLQTNQTPYNWTAPPFAKPSTNNLNIYELHFRDFTEEGTYLAAIERLDYLKGLGVNAIHVMPVSEFEGNSSWGYNPNFYFAPDKAYGTKDDLKRFIDECHKREIQVFNDLVLNHAFFSNVMGRMYWNQALNRPADDSPFFNPLHRMVANPAGWWGIDWNHESEHVQLMVDRALDFWLQEYRFDGFRFDFTKGFGQSPQNPGDEWASNFNQARIDLLKRMIDGMWARNPGSVAIFEHLAVNAEDKVLADHGILMWSGVGHHNDVKGFILGYNGDNTNIYDSGIFNAPARNFIFANWMSYAESHDEERLGYEVLQFGNGISTEPNPAIKLAKAIDRLKIGAAFNLLFPGPRMIWQFQELGYDYSINFNGRTGEKPVRWDYYDDLKRRELYTLFAHLFYFRNNYSLYATTPDYGNIGLGAGNLSTPRRMRLHDGAGHYVIVVANLDPFNSQTVTPGYGATGTWYRYNGDPLVDGSSYTVNTLGDTYTLAPSEVLVLVNFKRVTLSDPEDQCAGTELMYFTADPAGGTFTTTAPSGFSSNGAAGTATLDTDVTPPGTYEVSYTYIDALGAPVTQTVEVAILANATGMVAYTTCQGSGYEITVGETTFNEANPAGMVFLEAANGCDSVVTVSLTFLPNATGTETYTGCQGDGYSVTVGETTFNEANPTGMVVLEAANGCDSVVTISLTFLPHKTTNISHTTCEGNEYYVLVGSTYFDETNPTGVVVLEAANGCDSTINVNLTFLPNSETEILHTGCQGDGYSVTVGETTFNEANPTGLIVLEAANGCDSVVFVELIFLPNTTGTETYTGCQGDGYSVTVGETTFNEANPAGMVVLEAANGCDSVVTVSLTFLPNATGTETYTGCQGDGYLVTVGETTFNEANPTGMVVLEAANGCDSVVTVSLTFLPNATGTETYTGCQGDGYSVTVGETTFNEANPTGMVVLEAANGCDSVVTVSLTFLPNATGTETYTGCQGDGYLVTVGETTFNEANPTGMVVLEAANGCDSVVTVSLTFLPNATGTETYTGCQGDGYEVTVGETTFNEANPTGMVVLEAANGCDSVVTVNLAFLAPNPVARCSTSISLPLDDEGTASLTAAQLDNGSSVDCGGLSLSASPLAFDCDDLGSNPVTLTVTSLATGAATQCTTTVIITDPTVACCPAPQLTCLNANVVFNGQSSIALNPASLVSIEDDCGISGITALPANITCNQVGSTVPVTITVANQGGLSASCTSQIAVQGLPCGWSAQPSGVNCANGNTVSHNPTTDTYTLISSDCYYAAPFTSDELAFMQHTLCGNGSIMVEVASITGGQGWAGLIMRDGNAANARKVQLTANLGGFARREVRYTTGGQAYPQQFPIQERQWLRLLRVGNQFVGYVSANGTSWSQVFSVTVAMNNCIEMGLVVTNVLQNGSIAATFNHLSATGAASLEAPEPGAAFRAGDLQMLSLLAYPNPASDELNIAIEGLLPEGERHALHLTDAFGRSLLTRIVDGPTAQLQLGQLPPGIYELQLCLPDGRTLARRRVMVLGQ